MTVDGIRKRLEDAGLRPHHEWTSYDGNLTLEVSGPPSAWQKALGPTLKQATTALTEAFAAQTKGDPWSITRTGPQVAEAIMSALARLYS